MIYSLLFILCLVPQIIYPRFKTSKPMPEKQIEVSLIKDDGTTLIEQKNAVAPQPIVIKNSITPEMLAYNHWSGKHSPDTFFVEIEGEKMAEGEAKQLVARDKTCTIVYHYSFAKGLYTGKRSCTVPLPDNTQQASLVFSWTKEPRVWIEAATETIS